MLFFLSKNCRVKIVHFTGIRTRIIGVEGKHADHHPNGPTKYYWSNISLNIFPLAWYRYKWYYNCNLDLYRHVRFKCHFVIYQKMTVPTVCSVTSTLRFTMLAIDLLPPHSTQTSRARFKPCYRPGYFLVVKLHDWKLHAVGWGEHWWPQ